MAPLFLLGDAVDFFGGAQPQRCMRSTLIVRLNRLVYGASGLCFTVEAGSQSIFALQYPIHSLGQGVLRTMILLRHADSQSSLGQNGSILMRTVLRPSIRMMNRPRSQRQLRQSHLQGQHTTPCFQSLRAVVADDFPRALVRHQRQKQETFTSPHVCQIPHPHLVGPAHRQPPDQIWIYRQLVLRTGRAHPLPRQAPPHQILRSQQSKKTIAPQFHTRLLQGRLQDVPQLARPQARLTKPLCSHQPQDQLRIHLLPLALATPRIIILPAHSHLLTQPTHGDSPQRAIPPYGLMSGCPAAFSLTYSTASTPA